MTEADNPAKSISPDELPHEQSTAGDSITRAPLETSEQPMVFTAPAADLEELEEDNMLLDLLKRLKIEIVIAREETNDTE